MAVALLDLVEKALPVAKQGRRQTIRTAFCVQPFGGHVAPAQCNYTAFRGST